MRLTINHSLLVLLVAILGGGEATAAATENETTFKPGQVWLDTGGKPIQSHLGGILYDQGTYYWYGMNFDGKTLPPNTVDNQFSWMDNPGVSVYSSRDLCNWKLEGVSRLIAPLILPNDMLIRPKVIKNDTTGKYIMMAQRCAANWLRNDVLVATADSAIGPFSVHGILNPPDGAYDITLYKDDDGKAYLITAHEWVKVSELSDDYQSIKTTTAIDGARGEAPAIFKNNGVYYFVGSQLTGWAPNANHYATAPSILGPWTNRGTFATGPGSENTFASQTTFVLPVANRLNCFIFMADRTNAKSGFLVDDLSAMTHVWLPIAIDHESLTMTVPWRDAWDLSVFDRQHAKQ